MKAPQKVTTSNEREQARIALAVSIVAMNSTVSIIADFFDIEVVFSHALTEERENLEEMARAYDSLMAFDAGEIDDPGLNMICYWLVVSHNDDMWLRDEYRRGVNELRSNGMVNLDILNAILERYGRRLAVVISTAKPKAMSRRSKRGASA